MTIFSLGNACDLEHFSINTKLGQENFENMDYQSPVVPMPTEPPSGQFGNTTYQWNSESSGIQQMTKRRSNSGTFQPSVGRDSQDWESINFGPDVWGPKTDSYTSSNKLLNNNNGPSQVQPEVIMPNMKPQNAFMPTSRGQFVGNEDMHGRDKRQKIIKKVVQAIVEKEPELPDYDTEKIANDQKNLWFFIIALLIIVVGSVMYKANYF